MYVTLTSFDLFVSPFDMLATALLIVIDLWLQGQKPSSLIRAQQNGLLDQPKNLFSDKFRLLTERALHKFARKNISRSLRGYDEEEEEEEVTEVIMMDWFEETQNTKNL